MDPAAPDPKTAAKKNTEVDWARKQIFEKGKARAEFLQYVMAKQNHANRSYVGPANPDYPPVDWIKQLRKMVFVVDADWAQLRQAVDAEVANLNADPMMQQLGYTFTVVYTGS